MTAGAKINFSGQELQLMCNKEWILTKRNVIDKMATLMGTIAPGLQAMVSRQPGIPAEVKATNAKLHKGENYLGLPYLLLDYPAFFSREGNFAIRTFFWWGHFFSVTLHLSGRYHTMYAGNLVQSLALLQQYNYSFCVNTNEWQHHFEVDNYMPAAELDKQYIEAELNRKTFVKLAARFELTAFSNLAELVTGTAEKMLQISTA